MRFTLFVSLAWIAGAFAAPAAAAELKSPRPPLAVFDLSASGATPLETQAVTVGLVRGLRELDVFEVLSSGDVRELLAIERTRQLMGDTASSEFTRMNETLGARHAIVGGVRAEQDQLIIDLRLLDTSDAKVLAQRSSPPVPRDAAAKEASVLVQQLVAPLLEAQQGALLVRTNEEGAELRVDDTVRGSTPLAEPVKLSRGTHRLEVRKDGFIAQVKPVRIEPDQVTVEEVKLIPSADYAEAWRQRHGRLRVGAWVATAVAAGAFGGALLLNRSSDELYANEFLPRRSALASQAPVDFSDAQLRTFDGCNAEGRAACVARIEDVKGRISAQQYGTIGLGALGVAATAGATWLWLSGEDPNRYGNLVAGVALGPAPGFALAGSF